MDETAAPIPALRLVGVYHADGSLIGELRYWVGARIGASHCSLCDITHGTFRTKPEWTRRQAELGLPFETVHLDERSAALVAATEGSTPCVAAETDGGYVVLLDPQALEACSGSVDELFTAVAAAAVAQGIALGPIN